MRGRKRIRIRTGYEFAAIRMGQEKGIDKAEKEKQSVL